RRAGQRLWNLGGEPAAKAVGLDEGEVADGAGATREPLPVLGDTGTIRADGAEAGDDDLCHAERSFPAMRREWRAKEAKCSASARPPAHVAPRPRARAPGPRAARTPASRPPGARRASRASRRRRDRTRARRRP